MPVATPSLRRATAASLTCLAVTAALSGCGGGPRLEARPQSITFAAAPVPALNQLTATVVATASSGLPVRYASRTPALCAVDAAGGQVTSSGPGTCTIAASQPGDARYAAALTVAQDLAFTVGAVITFGPAPALAVHDLATVTATERTGAPVTFSSTTPVTCSVDAATGLVTALAEGDCTVAAASGGAEASQTIPVAAPSVAAPPEAPAGVTATSGAAPGTALVRVGALRAGGSAITGSASRPM